MLRANKPLVHLFALKAFADRSGDWWVMSENLPKLENRVVVSGSGRITVHWSPTNRRAHHRLIAAAKTMMKRAGYPIALTQTMTIETNSHQRGPARFANDLRTSLLDPFRHAHDVEKLYVVDRSSFP